MRVPAHRCVAALAGLAILIVTALPSRALAGEYAVRIEKSVLIQMSDGIKLSTDLYIPQGAPKPLPAILIRTPYNKKGFRRPDSDAFRFARLGYVVAVQDKRGKFESGGLYVMAGHELEDGNDTLNWLARQPWSNGKVGTYGCSDLGDAQIYLAQARNPHHAAMIAQSSGSSVGSAGGRYRYFGARNGGAVELAMSVGWMPVYGNKLFYRPPADVAPEVWRKFAEYFDPAPKLPDFDYAAIRNSLPLIDMMKRAGAPPNDWVDVMTRSLTDPWWDQFAYLRDDSKIDVPSLFINSWYDFGIAETLLEFTLFRRNGVSKRARDNQFIIISPMPHCASHKVSEKTVVGARPLGDARFDYYGVYEKWFAFWLKGEKNAVTTMPRVRYYVMGRNVWKSADDWPLPSARATRFYLHSDGGANSLYGSGALSTEKPGTEPADRFVYDPGNPVPSFGGPVCCTKMSEAEGAYDQRPIEARDDVLVYTSKVLTTGIEVTGPIKLVLYVSSSARDTDFTAKLIDVYPDGRAFNLQEGILRARYRDGFDKTVWMEPGEVYRLEIDLQATSNYFAPGHRIRLEVSSSNFPRFDRNLNTGGNNYDETGWQVARNVVHHSARYPSQLILPVVAEGGN